MTKQEKELFDSYNSKRLDMMGTLQNKLVDVLKKNQLPTQDVLMVLRIVSKQVEEMFLTNGL